MTKGIIFVSGPVCSGKTTIAMALSSSYRVEGVECLLIDVGQIVKAIIKTSNREALQDTEHLMNTITLTIQSKIEKFEEKVKTDDHAIIICGIRQVQILEHFHKLFPTATLMWLSVSFEERYRRWSWRADVKDGTDNSTAKFQEINERDEKLGLLEVKQYTQTQG